jgi:hypothetical protein
VGARVRYLGREDPWHAPRAAMSSLPIDVLDRAFADEVEEVASISLLGYQPILERTVLLRFQHNLEAMVEGDHHLDALRDRGVTPIPLAPPLTASQVSLLGGTRPARTLRTLERRLHIPPQADRREQDAMLPLLLPSREALESVTAHYVVAPIQGPEDRLRELRAFLEVGIAVQFAALMGALDARRYSGRSEEDPGWMERYFLGALQTFLRIKLSRSDQGVFRDYYLDEGNIEEIADERGRQLATEAKRRLGFLQRFAKELRAAILLHPDPSAARPPAVALPDGDPRAPAQPLLIEAATETGDAKARPPLKRAASPGARPRKR